MFTTVVAVALSNLLNRDTIYTVKLRRRGADVVLTTPRSVGTRSVATSAGGMDDSQSEVASASATERS